MSRSQIKGKDGWYKGHISENINRRDIRVLIADVFARNKIKKNLPLAETSLNLMESGERNYSFQFNCTCILANCRKIVKHAIYTFYVLLGVINNSVDNSKSTRQKYSYVKSQSLGKLMRPKESNFF